MTTTGAIPGVGAPVRRIEDRAFLTGRGRYLDDIAPPGVLSGYVLRSAAGHARFSLSELDRARALPGVRLVLAAADVLALGYSKPPGAKNCGNAFSTTTGVFAGPTGTGGNAGCGTAGAANMITLTMDHNFSKRTAAGLMYTTLKSDANTSTGLFYQSNNAYGGQLTNMNGETQNITSLALRHNF